MHKKQLLATIVVAAVSSLAAGCTPTRVVPLATPSTAAQDGGAGESEMYAVMEGRFRADEVTTAADEKAATKQIVDAFSSPLLGNSHLEAVECRKSLCRFIATNKDSRADHELFDHLFGARGEPMLPWGGSFAARNRVYHDDGSTTVTVYAGRGINAESVGK